MKRAYRSKTEVSNVASSVFTEEDRWERRNRTFLHPPTPPSPKISQWKKKTQKRWAGFRAVGKYNFHPYFIIDDLEFLEMIYVIIDDYNASNLCTTRKSFKEFYRWYISL